MGTSSWGQVTATRRQTETSRFQNVGGGNHTLQINAPPRCKYDLSPRMAYVFPSRTSASKFKGTCASEVTRLGYFSHSPGGPPTFKVVDVNSFAPNGEFTYQAGVNPLFGAGHAERLSPGS